MEEDDYLSPYCICCLQADANLLQKYKVQNESLKNLIQDEVILCYICLKIAQYTELFLKNVQINQLTLQDSIFKNNVKPLITLSVAKLEPVELTGLDNTEDEYSILDSAVNTIKREPKDEDVKCEEYFSDYYECPIKQEDDMPLSLKEEITLDIVGSATKTHKKIKNKKKISKKDTENSSRQTRSKDIVYTKITLTDSDLSKERKQKLADASYLNYHYKCSECILGFKHKITYQNHMKLHGKSAGNYSCDICKQNLKTYTSLSNHVQNHYIRYKCILCDIQRNNSASARNHYFSAHSEIKKPYNCPKIGCNKTFRLQKHVSKHFDFVHKEKTKVVCKFCNQSYKSIYNHWLNKHPTEVSAIKKEKIYSCGQCDVSFASAANLSRHMIKHSDKKDFYCVECDKWFKTAVNFKAHLQTSVHLSPKDFPFACNHCDKRFLRKSLLERHMLRVKNIRKHACDQCDKSFIFIGQLNLHKKLAHEGYELPRKHKCEYCEKSFKTATTLKHHILIHTGERPYQCKLCSATFNQSSVLRTHTRLIHLRIGRDIRKSKKGRENDGMDGF